MKKFFRESWLVLMLGSGFALMLGAAQAGLGPKIEQNQKDALGRAVFEVVPDAARFTQRELGLDTVFECFDKADKRVGWAVRASGFGFQDKITLVYGLTPDAARVTGLKVIDNKETPGLGNRIEENDWRGQFNGLDPSLEIQVTKSARKDTAHEIQAITGATISSRSVTKIVNQSLAAVRPKLLEIH